MPVNYDGRCEVRVFYTTLVSGVTLEHKQTFDVNLETEPETGDDFSGAQVHNHDASSQDLGAMVIGLVELEAEAMENTADFNTAELWFYGTEPSTDAVFISAMNLATPGLSGGSTIAAQQATLTFRSKAGGIARLQLMEVITNLNTKLNYPSSSTVYNDIMDFFSAATNGFLARDNSHPFNPLRQSFGQNEKLWRKRFRP